MANQDKWPSERCECGNSWPASPGDSLTRLISSLHSMKLFLEMKNKKRGIPLLGKPHPPITPNFPSGFNH